MDVRRYAGYMTLVFLLFSVSKLSAQAPSVGPGGTPLLFLPVDSTEAEEELVVPYANKTSELVVTDSTGTVAESDSAELFVDSISVGSDSIPALADSIAVVQPVDSAALEIVKEQKLLRLVDKTEIDISPRARALLQAAIKARENFAKYDSFDDTIIVNPLFMPIIFQGSVYPKNFEIYRKPAPPRPDRFTLGKPVWLAREMALDSLRQRQRNRIVVEHPEYIRYDNASLPEVPKSKQMVSTQMPTLERLTTEKPKLRTFNVALPKISYWVVKVHSNLSFAQIAYSDHYGSGQDNVNVRSQQDLSVNYNPFKKFTFNLTAQWVLNVNNAPDDTLRSLRIIEDKFILNTNMGLKAFKRWTYSLSTRLETQFFNNYPANSKVRNAAFLAPGNFTLGLGMTYSIESKNKKMTFSCSPQPISYNILFVRDGSGVDPVSIGIPSGNTLNKIGSTLDAKFVWTIIPEIQYTTTLWYFTNYESVSARWNNQFAFSITRLLNATLTFNADYYDTTRKKADGYFQYMESTALGLSYHW